MEAVSMPTTQSSANRLFLSLLVAIVKEKDESSWMTTVFHLATWTAVVVAAPEVAER